MKPRRVPPHRDEDVSSVQVAVAQHEPAVRLLHRRKVQDEGQEHREHADFLHLLRSAATSGRPRGEEKGERETQMHASRRLSRRLRVFRTARARMHPPSQRIRKSTPSGSLRRSTRSIAPSRRDEKPARRDRSTHRHRSTALNEIDAHGTHRGWGGGDGGGHPGARGGGGVDRYTMNGRRRRTGLLRADRPAGDRLGARDGRSREAPTRARCVATRGPAGPMGYWVLEHS